MTNSLSRLWQIRNIIKQHGLVELLDDVSLTAGARLSRRILFGGKTEYSDARGVRIRLALESLGPVFIKLGQALSTRPDLLPPDIALELTKLQDQVPPFAGVQALEIIRQTYGSEFDTIFESVDSQPLASASVARSSSQLAASIPSCRSTNDRADSPGSGRTS